MVIASCLAAGRPIAGMVDLLLSSPIPHLCMYVLRYMIRSGAWETRAFEEEEEQQQQQQRQEPPRSLRQQQQSQEDVEEGQSSGEPRELVELRGTVKRVVYSNGDNGFTVMKLESEVHEDLVNVVGVFPTVNAGAAISLKGYWKRGGKYGDEFRAREYVETAPATLTGLENYLASGLVKGVGPVVARQIVGHFGNETLSVLNDAPHRLVEVEGIGAKKAAMITKAWQGQREVTNVMMFLQSHNVSTTLATKIYKTYGNGSVTIVRSDPFRLVDEITGMGFRTVDKIAQQLGFDKEAPKRLRSGLLYYLREIANEGHCFGWKQPVLKGASKLLTATVENLESTLGQMISKGEVITHEDPVKQDTALFLPFFHTCESQTALRLHELLVTESPLAKRIAASCDSVIQKIQETNKVGERLDEDDASERRDGIPHGACLTHFSPSLFLAVSI